MTIEEKMERRINQARKGREKWLQLKENYKIDKSTYIILFPEEKTQCNKYTLKYLPFFSKKLSIKHIILLSYDKEVLNTKIDCPDLICESIFWTHSQAEELMAYYMVQIFTENFIIASLDLPEGRKAGNIIGINGVTEEEVVSVGILGIKELQG